MTQEEVMEQIAEKVAGLSNQNVADRQLIVRRAGTRYVDGRDKVSIADLLDTVKQILLIPELLIEAPNQDLPEFKLPSHISESNVIAGIAYEWFTKAQLNMLKPKDGYVWMKVKEKK